MILEMLYALKILLNRFRKSTFSGNVARAGTEAVDWVRVRFGAG